MKLPARVTDPDGYPGVAVRVVWVEDALGKGLGWEVIGPDNIIRTFPSYEVSKGWPEKEDPYVAFLRENS